jgi:beta-aspartyl-peptidase (threonine type)
MTLAIIVHGGASTIAPEKVEAYKAGCLAAVRAGWAALEGDKNALDAVEAAVRVLEDDPTFNAGVGASLNKDGVVELDAGIMESSGLHAGGVGAIQGVPHPISVARQVLASGSVLLVGAGAERFASDLITEEARRSLQEQQQRMDTVGCVALDALGILATGASTGGVSGKAPGRVGDTPLVGCGIYAEEQHGACAMTGIGETIIQVALARTVIEFLAEGQEPATAAEQAIRVLEERVQGEGGCIVLDPAGRIGWAHNSPDMACAYMTSEMDAPEVWIRKPKAA